MRKIYLLIFVTLVILVSCRPVSVSQAETEETETKTIEAIPIKKFTEGSSSDPNGRYRQSEFELSGMHYVLISYYEGGITCINVTNDSLDMVIKKGQIK